MSENLIFESIYTEDLYQLPSKTQIIITKPWSELSEAETEQLTKITEALRQRINPKLKLDAFQVVYTPILDLSTWIEKPQRLIYFGPAIKGLNYFELIETGLTKMVLSESLSDLITNEASRQKLWIALKQLFSA
jgi:hypothetical protein